MYLRPHVAPMHSSPMLDNVLGAGDHDPPRSVTMRELVPSLGPGWEGQVRSSPKRSERAASGPVTGSW